MATNETPARGAGTPNGAEDIDEAVYSQDRPPAYDLDREHYVGISSGPLSDIDDVRAARDLAEMIVDTIRESLLVLDLDHCVQAANASFYHTFKVDPDATIGRHVYDLGNGQWDIPELRRLLEDVLPHNDVFNDFEVEHEFEGIGYRVMLLNARRLDDHQLILLTIEDVTELRAGEELRRTRDERLRRLADAVPALLWVTDPSGRCTFLNQAWYDYTGQTKREALGFGWLDAVHPEDRDRARAVFLAANERQEGFQLDYRLRRHDGTYRWSLDSGRPHTEPDGTLLGYLGSVVDIDDRKRAEQALRESQRTAQARLDELEATYATAPVGLCVLDTELRFLRINERLAEINGLPVEAHLGRTIHDVVPAVADDIEPTLRRIIATGKPALDVEITGETAAQPGTRRTWVESWFPLFDGDGHVVGVNVVAEEVTERKRTEGELASERAQLEAIIDTLPVGLVITNAEGRIVRDNAAARELWGMPLHAQSWEDYGGFVGWWPDTGERIRAEEWAMSRALRCGETTRGELVQNQELGSDERHYYLNNVAPVFDAEGRIRGAVGAMLDVTDRIQMEKALKELNETLEARVEERTHQVRELSRALTLAEQRERQRIAHVLHDELQQLLFGAKMASSFGDAERLQTVLDQAMMLTRTLSHELSPPFLQGEGIEDLLRWLAERKREHYGLEVEVEVRDDVPVADADLRVLLYQLLRELLFNVVKHAGTGRARLVAERVGERVRVVVEDEGAGFDPAELDDRQAGGIGLPSVRERLELVGGELDVESAPGQGTRITITVPPMSRGAKRA